MWLNIDSHLLALYVIIAVNAHRGACIHMIISVGPCVYPSYCYCSWCHWNDWVSAKKLQKWCLPTVEALLEVTHTAQHVHQLLEVHLLRKPLGGDTVHCPLAHCLPSEDVLALIKIRNYYIWSQLSSSSVKNCTNYTWYDERASFV